MIPSSFCSPSIILFGSFGLFKAKQYFEHLSPSFKNQAWAESFALSSFSFPILFRELLRNMNSSLTLFLFSSVTLLEVVLLFWVSISLLRSFISLFTLALSSSVILMPVSLMFSLTFFHLVCGFCPLLLSTVISSTLSHRHSLVVYSDIHLLKDLSILSDISLNFFV